MTTLPTLHASPTGPVTAPTGSATVPVEIETFALRVVDGALGARVVRRPLVGDPDDCASASIGLDRSASAEAVLHSTSWRWVDGSVVLTYVCCPDPSSDSADDIITPAHRHRAGEDPTRPGGDEPTPSEVLHHGIDHLAWLADHHPSLIERSVHTHPQLWDHVVRAGRHRAGRFPQH